MRSAPDAASRDHPVRIAGAGLAGLTAAIHLARRAVPVEIFEKQSDSGAARHGAYDAVENWTTGTDFPAVLSDWQIDARLHPVSRLEVYDFQGRCYPLSLQRPLFYLVKRGIDHDSLEQSLKRQALSLGVRIHYREALIREQADVWAVGAQQRGFFLGAGLTFRSDLPDLMQIIVDQRLAPKACAYFMVVEGQATLSVVLTQQFRRAREFLNEALRVFQRIQPFEMREARFSSGFGGLLPAFRLPPTLPITIGEAAGFQDYLWGFGIRHALLSGTLAARAIADQVDYEQLVARDIYPLVQSSLINRMFYGRAGNRLYRALIQRFSTTHNLHEWMCRAYQSRKIRFVFSPLVRQMVNHE